MKKYTKIYIVTSALKSIKNPYIFALELNINLPQALNNIAVIYHYQGVKASKKQNLEIAKGLFDKAAEYWRQAIKLAPNNYIEAQNWLKTTGRLTSMNF